ncbi:AfsA-related hotdog domain-containing protein [Marinimicrobium sp. ABcell2]|uniref:AfsA-related hotdog domain-containing protein n=1 Tax=Marinimicrobium sp. ABcell2 TaxID=3069751 RepID=UPI0027B435B0|nr:AfsA-related hotdog domain-containing protein [Marinimicrobium sp. ABcell2]MDQ2077926.1 AfsA-related hotdog domain-containing protein [Marinimicrobium sp. ABcell2]
MNNRILLVVGDKFASYVKNKDAITVSQLRGLLSLPVHMLPSQSRTVLVPGQGMGDDCVNQLLQDAAASPNVSHFDFSLWHSLPQRASSKVSHKRNPRNTLISEPRQLSEDTFELHLMIDEDCELMNDHLSGQHVQGMVLIEAARQAMLAVTEQFLMPDNGIDYAFIFNALSVSYSHYTFPVSAVIRTRITERSVDNPRRLSFAAETFVEQCGKTVSEFTMSFGAMERARISKREGMQASKTQGEFLSSLASNIEEYDEPMRHVENV